MSHSAISTFNKKNIVLSGDITVKNIHTHKKLEKNKLLFILAKTVLNINSEVSQQYHTHS